MERDDLTGDRLTLATLASQLAQAMGEEKAREVVETTATELGLAGSSLTREQALEVLERIADTPGIVGVCARFARTRVMLASVQLGAKR
ncbi:MAG: hypothetical protein AAF721_24675 [Myxococcota bacterium]